MYETRRGVDESDAGECIQRKRGVDDGDAGSVFKEREV